MHIIINLFYLFILMLALPFLLWRIRSKEGYGEILRSRLRAVPPRGGDEPCIWIHAVSVGEVKLAAGLAQEIERQLPGHEIAVSSTTVQGMEVARKTFAGRTVFNSPLDFGWVVRRDCRHLRPSCLVLVELELWPNLLLAAKRAGIPVVVINCRITERSFRGYRLLHTFVPGFIPSLGVGAFCPQNEVYAERLRGLGIPPERVRVTGSMKYDGLRAKVDPSRREALRRQFGFREDDLVLVGASTHDDEEAQMAGVFPAIVKEFPAARLVLVPRHVERAEAACKAASQAGLRPVRKTQLSEREAPAKDWRTVVVVDTMGELIDVMSLAAVVFVGKSISAENRGGHNVLEPAALGRPVVFGPFMANFQSEAEFLLANGAARQVRGKNGLRDVCLDLLRSPAMREEMGRKGAALVAQNQGATRRNVEVIRGMMGE